MGLAWPSLASDRNHSNSEPFALKSSVTVRQESFGCLCCNAATGEYFQFNPDALVLFQHLLVPTTFAALRQRLASNGLAIPASDLAEFLDLLRFRGLIGSKGIDYAATIYTYAPTAFQSGCLIAPSSCTLYVTEVCPKRCRHCIVRSHPRVATTGYLSLDQWERVLKRLREWGVLTLTVTGGEPLIRSDIFELLDLASELGFSVALLTDFDGFAQRHVDRLRSISGLNYLQTSVDGASDTTHDFLRGNGSFRRTLRRLDLFRENDLRYTISTVVHRGNFCELRGIVDIYHAFRAYALYLNPLAPYGRAGEELSGMLLSDDQLRSLALIYHYLVSREGVNSLNAFWQSLTDEQALAPDFHPFNNVEDIMSVGSYVLSIGPRGECYLDSKMKSEGLLRLGNALTDDLEAMWHAGALSRLRSIPEIGQPRMVRHPLVLSLLNEERLASIPSENKEETS